MKKFKYYIFAFLTVLFWSIYFPLGKYVLSYIDTTSFAFLRFFIGFLFLILFLSIKYLYLYLKIKFYKNNKNKIEKYNSFNFNIFKKNLKIFILIFLAGIIGITIHQYIQVKGLNLTTATNTTWIIAFVPIVTSLFSFIFLKENITKFQIIGMIIAFTGILILSDIFKINLNSISKEIAGNLLIFASCITWAIYTILNKKTFKYIEPLNALPLIFFVGITFLYIVIKFNKNIIDPFIIFKANNKKLVFYMLLIGIFPSGLGYIFWYSALNKIGANKTTFFVYLEPLLTTTLSISFLKEKLMPKHIISAILIISGLIIFEQYNFILFYYKQFSKNILKSLNKS